MQTPQPNKDTPSDWHHISVETLLKRLEVDPDAGLSEEEAAQRLAKQGANALPQKRTVPAWLRFLKQFNNLLILVLIGAAVLAGVLGEWLEVAVILAVVLVNASIGFVQEGKAEKALKAIQDMLSESAYVKRGAKRQKVAARELVVGDIVYLEAGDKIPADLRLLQVNTLATQEAMLTGESLAVEKNTQSQSSQAALGDRFNMAYSGTLVTQGQGVGVVVASGEHTELGRVNRMLSDVEQLTTPLLRQMAQFARYLTLVILAVALAVFALGLWRGYEVSYMFMAVVSLVVAAIPEGLPTILTVALAIGVTRMAHRHAIIRRLPAVETIGAVSVICSDKTGTLTRNEMTVTRLCLPQGDFTVSGVGYAPEGTLQAQSDDVHEDDAQLALQVAMLCNNAQLRQREHTYEVHGDPMEGALLTLAGKGGYTFDALQAEFPRVEELPFDSRYKYMATAHQQGEGNHEGSQWVFVKGAPEVIFERCDKEQGRDGAFREQHWPAQVDSLAAEGHRVLALAYKQRRAEAGLDHEDVKQGLTLLGLVAIMDPPREEAIAAVDECRSAGIRVKMITGDHAATAMAIGKQLHLQHCEHALTGRDIENMDDTALTEALSDTDVFARTTPEHKLRLVELLQQQQHVVAMTGDGVNDAPALKRADIGIAMGRGGTAAAREASEMVLTDDNFASIVKAVHEGRTVYDNLKKALTFLLPVNGGESLAIMLALLFALTLPIMPLQILWVNMVSSIALALALAFEASEKDVMQRPPRAANEPWLSGFILWRVAFVSVLFTIGIFAVFNWALAQGHSEAYARTLAVNTLVAMEVWYLFSVRYLRSSSLSWGGSKGNRPVLTAVCLVFVLQLAFTYAPWLQRLFDTQGLHWQHGLLCVAVGALLFLVLESEKYLQRRFNPLPRARANW